MGVAARQEGWEVAVRGILEGYEKADRKKVCKQIGGLRADRDRLRRAMDGAREGSARYKALRACLQRRDRQIQALKIRMGMTEEERARRGLWSLGKDQRLTHEVLGGGGSTEPQDVLKIKHPTKGTVTTQEDILDLHRRAESERHPPHARTSPTASSSSRPARSAQRGRW